MTALSRQAKAIAAVLVTFLVQVQVYVGQGGIAELQAVTLGQWISVVIATAGAYGIVYAIPNTDRRVAVDTQIQASLANVAERLNVAPQTTAERNRADSTANLLSTPESVLTPSQSDAVVADAESAPPVVAAEAPEPKTWTTPAGTVVSQ